MIYLYNIDIGVGPKSRRGKIEATSSPSGLKTATRSLPVSCSESKARGHHLKELVL